MFTYIHCEKSVDELALFKEVFPNVSLVNYRHKAQIGRDHLNRTNSTSLDVHHDSTTVFLLVTVTKA